MAVVAHPKLFPCMTLLSGGGVCRRNAKPGQAKSLIHVCPIVASADVLHRAMRWSYRTCFVAAREPRSSSSTAIVMFSPRQS